MIERVAIVGAGNGGKTAAADLSLQGKKVRLFELPEYGENLEPVAKTRTLVATGAVSGEAFLECVTTDLAEALDGVDTVMVCTQALAHERVARALAPHVLPGHLIVLNPGSTGGALHFAQLFRALGLGFLPTMAETATLTYGCRARGSQVHAAVKVKRVLYGTFPGSAVSRVGPELEALFPGLVRCASVLEAGLNNGNPVIHPPITLLNGARIENEGPGMRFYGDGVSPTVARLIEKLDKERMAILKALGYPAQTEPLTSVQQGYAESEDYHECYRYGPGFVEFRSPDTLDHRYFHEDVGMGLVLYCSLGELLGVPTPVSRAFVHMGEAVTGVPYFKEGRRTLTRLGLDGLSLEQIKSFLETGNHPAA